MRRKTLEGKDVTPGHAFAEDYRGLRVGAYSGQTASANYDLERVKQRLSPERLKRYEVGACDPATAMRLYEWNMRAGGEFHRLLHGVEVILRNALHEQLTIWHGGQLLPGTWFEDPLRILDAKTRGDISTARQRILQVGRRATADRLVSELSFGFWRFLLAAKYERTLWTPALRHAFPNLVSRRRADIADPVVRLHQLRNRIAHQEPITQRRLEEDWRDAMAVVGAICDDSRRWLERTGGFAALVSLG